MENLDILLNENLDIIKEIGSIGMGHASTSLSQMVNLKVTMTTPTVYILTPAEISEHLKKRSKGAYGVYVGLQGDSKGVILQLLSKRFALRIISYYFQNEIDSEAELDEMGLSVVQEIGNITSGAYCNSLASMTGLFIDISTPTHCKNIDTDLKLDEKNPVEKAIVINNSFFMDGEEETSDFLFMPDLTTTEQVLIKLKEYYGLTS